MNKLKYIFLSLALLITIDANAQKENYDAIEKAFTETLHKFSIMADTLASNISLAHKKEPEVQVRLARAYFRNREESKARAYVQKAIDIDPTYVPAYIYGSTMELYFRDTTKAIEWCEKAMKANPSNPQGYLEFVNLVAKNDAKRAIASLDQLKANAPTYPIAAAQASIWYNSGHYDDAVKLYETVDSSTLDALGVATYAAAHYFLQHFDKSLALVQYGLTKFPDNAPLNRVAMYNYAELKKYNEAIDYGKKLLDILSGKADPTYRDVTYIAMSYNGKREHNKAIDIFTDYVINSDTAYEYEDRLDATQRVKKIVDDLKALGDFDEAANTYAHYLEKKKKTTDYDHYLLTEIYKEKLDDEMMMNGDTVEAYYDLDAAYTKFENEHGNWDQIDLVYYFHGVYTNIAMDPSAKKGLAKPYYDVLISLINRKEVTSREQSMLKNAYNYLMFHYYLIEQNRESKRYANLLLKIDPTNTTAQQISKLRG